MNSDVVQKLNDLNRAFYQKVGTFFDESRDYFWPGWDRVLLYIDKVQKEPRQPFRVLDLGCGNGRFGQFLKENFAGEFDISYTGIDFDSFLLSQAKKTLPDATFYEADILNLDLDSFFRQDQIFDLIVLFGVMHHIPGFQTREELLSKLVAKLNPDGFLIFSVWEFLESASLRERIHSWSELNLEEQVEDGDYLLDWQRGEEALRYCHHFSDIEIEKLCKSSLLEITDIYRSNKKGDRYNKYIVTSV